MQTLWSRFSRSTAARILAPVVVIGCLMLTAAHPFTFGAMPDTHDGLLHFYRLVALDHAVQHGDVWPRYAPGLVFGYGAPIFNYYAPLSLYPFELLHLLGLRFLDAFLIGLIGLAFAGAVGAYRLGKVWAGREGPVWEGQTAGIATAVAYAYAPYTLYNSPRRGAVAEFAALALLPWVLWAFWRLATHGRQRDLVLAVALLGLFIPLHNITTLHGAVLLAIYSMLLWWIGDDPPRTFVRLALAGVLAVGVTTFFWLPALGETGYVQLERATGPASADFHNNFHSLAETLALPMTADLTQIHPPVPRPLGWPQIVLGVVGLALIAWRGVGTNEGRRLRGWLALAAGLVVILIFLTTRASTWVWETVPLMHYTQLPWRMLGLASLLLAVLAGAGVMLVGRWIPRQDGRMVWVGLCLATMMVYAIPWLYGLYLPEPRAESIVDAQNFERETGWLATSSLWEYLPRWTLELPDENRLTGLYAQGDVIPRLQPAPGVSVDEAKWGVTGATLKVRVEEKTTLIFDWLYFPGWWARLDGEVVAIAPTQPQGFVGVEVPAGEHRLELGFGPTVLRLVAMIVSGVFLLGLVGVLFVRPLWRSGGETKPGGDLHPPYVGGGTADVGGDEKMAPIARPRLRGWWVFLVAAVVGVLLFAGKVFLLDNLETPIKRARFAHGVEDGLQTPVLASFGKEITLLGFDLGRAEVTSGRSTALALYWQLAGEMVEEDYSTVVYLRDAAGNVIAQTGSQHPGDWPTSDWVPGFYVQERLALDVPAATPPGQYAIHVALYSHLAKRNLDTFDAGGNPLGVTVEIGRLEVTRPRRPARLDNLDTGGQINAHLTDDVTLIGVNPPPASSEVGLPFPVVWYWRAWSQPEEAYGARLLWLEGEEVAAASPVIVPTTGYPSDRWARHDVWRGVHRVHVPGRLEAGKYDVAVQLTDAGGEPVGEWVVIGTMTVSTPPRTFNAPEMGVLADVAWENGLRLRGYDLPEEQVTQGDGLDLTLYWQPEEEIGTSLTVFVHLFDGEGHIVAQQDQIPVGGTRPTTGWAPGEVIGDPYRLFVGMGVPPGEYRVRVGWYDARTGERVRLVDGSDYWLLPQTVCVGGS